MLAVRGSRPYFAHMPLHGIARATASLALVASASLQDPTSPQTPQPSSPAQAPTAAAPQAPALVAGELPANASEDAKALWRKLLDAARAPIEVEDPKTHQKVVQPANPAKPSGFDLTFSGAAHPTERGSNEFPPTRYRFDARGWVRMTVIDSKRERISGPGGQFLVDASGVTSLAGREHEEDRRQIREELGIAKNFLALADPKSLRLAKLEKLAAAPSELPLGKLAELGKSLEWLSIESPDFHLFQSKTPNADANYRVQIGLDKAQHLPRLASVVELRDGKSWLESGALLVELANYAPLDGFQVPKAIATYGVDLERMPWGFSKWSSMNLDLLAGGKLRTSFSEADFAPPPMPKK